MEDTSYYILLIATTAIEVAVIVTVLSTMFRRSDESQRINDEKMQSFLRFMHIESQKNSKDVQRMIDENHKITNRMMAESHKETAKTLEEARKTNKDNAIFLRRIFEIVDNPEESKG